MLVNWEDFYTKTFFNSAENLHYFVSKTDFVQSFISRLK